MSKLNNWIIAVVLAIISFSCARKSYSSIENKEIEITAMALSAPVIKGVAANPLLRIRIYVPAGKTVNYNTIQAKLNQAAFRSIEKLDVFFTDSEPLFDTKNSIASIAPKDVSVSVPVSLSLQPGLHYIWLSATLKESASLEDKIEVHATGLVNESGKMQTIQEEASDFEKRIGIAVRKLGDDGVHTYRIPGIATTDRGTLLAVYDIRYKNSADLPGNIDVGLSRSTDGGQTWEPMKVIMDMGAPHENNGVGDPAILFDPATKTIWVAALWSKGNKSIAGSGPGLSPDETGQLVLVSSKDDGLTWSAPYSITPQVKNPKWHLFFNGPGNGTVMQDGTLVFAAQYWDENKMPHSTIIYSKDGGKTWKSNNGPKSNTTESQVIETAPGTLMLNMRDNRGSYRSIATTTNLGESWIEHPTSYKSLVDPVCMASIIKVPAATKGLKKDVVFFSNPATTTGRYNMTIKASMDNGESWQPQHQLLYDERFGYGYSALTRIDENTIGVLYEGVRDLYFLRIPVRAIIR